MSKYVCQLDYINIADWVLVNNANHCLLNKRIIEKFSDIRDGDIIFISTILLCQQHLFENLVRLNVRYILITGMCDETVPYFYEDNRRGQLDYRKILENPNLLGWFSINVDIKHPKIHCLPLGIPFSIPFISPNVSPEFSYMAWYVNIFGSEKIFNSYNNHSINNIINIMKSKKDSSDLLLCCYSTVNTDDCCVSRNNKIRYNLDEYLKTTKFIKHNLMPWEEYFNSMCKYKFALCPPGRGLDTHRTYEAIICGTIPIVFPALLNEFLYEDLPVLVIDSFDKINEEYLEEQYNRIISRNDYNFSKLTPEYWCEKINKFKSTQIQ